MKHLFYFFLLSLSLLYYSCNPSGTDDVEEEECLAGSPAAQLNCRVGFQDWRLVSITSDKERPLDSGGSTRNWMEFQPACFNKAVLNLNGFVRDDQNQMIGIYEIKNVVAPCVKRGGSPIESDAAFDSAELLVDQDASLYFYGIEFEDQGAVTDTWYDIRVEPGESLRYRVDKTFDSTDYRLEVEFERVDQ